MVKQGPYTVEIVRARTKATFPEHTMKNGETYVEAEADQEYYIYVSVDTKDPVVVEISVDGEDLGYDFITSRTIEADEYNGACARKDGKEYNYALKFDKKFRRGQEAYHNTSSNHFQPGKIEVFFSKPVFTGCYAQASGDCDNEWNGGDENFVSGIIDEAKDKTVKSVLGSQFEATPLSCSAQEEYEIGELLETVTLYYCSAKALISIGVRSTKGTTYDYYLEHLPYEPIPEFQPPQPVLMKQQMEICGRMQMVEVDTYDLTAEDD